MSYAIVNWDDLYENASTRKLKKLAWVPIPNGADSLGFLRMREEPDFSELYTCWILVLATASRCSSRGVLASSQGKAYTAADLELKWRVPAGNFQRCLDFCLQLGWVEDTSGESATTSGESATVLAGPAKPVAAKERRKGMNEGKDAPTSRLPTPKNLDTSDFRRAWGDWVQHRKEIKHPLTKTQATKQLEMLSGIGVDRAITALTYTIEKGWQGIREPEGKEAARIIGNKSAYSPDADMASLRKRGASFDR